MSGFPVLALALLLVAGFLIGGVINFSRERRWIPTTILAVLAVLAAAGAVLRLV